MNVKQLLKDHDEISYLKNSICVYIWTSGGALLICGVAKLLDRIFILLKSESKTFTGF